MKKVLIVVSVLVGLLLVGALAAPTFVDWNRYKDRIAARLEDQLGRQVSIAGDLSMTLLPAPALAADDLAVGGDGGNHGDRLSVKSLRLRLVPSALLQGRLQVASLVLVEPVLALSELPDPPRRAGDDAETGAGGDDRLGIAFDSLVVEDGTVVYGVAGEGVERVEDIDLTFRGDLSGPLAFDGEASWRGLRLQARGDTGRFQRGSVPLALDVALPRASTRAVFEGRWSEGAEGAPLVGRLTVSGSDLAALATVAGLEAPQAAGRRFRVEGSLRGQGRRVALDDVSLLVGETEGSGAVSLALEAVPRADVALAFRSLDLDTALAAVAPPPAEGAGAPPSAPDDAGFALPSGFAATLDLSADAVVWRGAILRQGELQAALREGVLSVERFSAFGPGGSDITAYGEVRAADGVPAFEAEFETAADNLRAVLDWLGVAVPDLPPDRLRKFAAKGAVRGTPASLQIPEVELWLDTSHARAAANIQRGGRLAVGANISLDTLNLDAYRPPPAQTAEGEARAEAPLPGGDWALLTLMDANLRARVERLTVGGRTLRDVTLDGTLLDGDVTLREARAGDVEGVGAVALAGGVAGLAGGAPVFDELAFTVQTPDPARVLRLAGLEPPVDMAGLSPASLAATLDGPVDNLGISSENSLGAGRLAVTGTVQELPGPPSYRLEVSASHPDTAVVVGTVWPGYRPAGTPGAFDFSGRIAGDGEEVALGGVTLSAGEVRLRGEATVALAARPRIAATVRGGDLDLGPLLPADSTALRLRPPPGVIPAVLGGAGAGSGSAPPRLQPAQARPAAPPAGSPWSTTPLPIGWFDAADAEVTFSADSLAVGGHRLHNPVATLALAEATARVERLKADLFGGAFTLSAQLAGDGSAAAQATLVNAAVDEALELAPGIALVAGRLSAEAEVAGRGDSSFALVSSLSGTGRMEVLEGVVEGIDLAGTSRSLRRLDGVAGLLATVREGFFGGRTTFDELRGSFAINDGVVASDDVRLVSEAGTGGMNALIDLPAWSLDARGSFALAEFPEAPPLAIRLQGALDSPRRSIDIEQLQGYLISRGLTRLLPQRQEAEPAPAPEEQTGETPRDDFEPEDIMRGLLDMLEQRRR